MHRLTLLAIMAATLYAQNPADSVNKPPAGVEEALRERVTQFYQLHVTQQYRKAEALVAEDTKDYFYSHNKPNYLGFEITGIKYSENFTRASVTVMTDQYLMLPGFSEKPMKMLSPSLWKLEDGKWCWYIDPETVNMTPFGKMSSAPAQSSTPARGPTGMPASIPTSPDFIFNKVRADKQAVTLKTGDSAQVKFTNTAQGILNLKVMDPAKGFEAKLDRTSLKPEGTAVLTIAAGPDARTGLVNIKVEQTGEVIAIKVAVE
jgi:hypothetical protein